MVASTGDPRTRDQWQLVISAAPGVVRRQVQPGTELVLGRGEQVDIDVQDDSVSRRHARLRIGDPLRVEDLGSRNGTFVHGRRLAAGQPEAVPLGSVVELGSTFLVVYRGSLAGGLAANPPSSEMLVVGETMQGLYALLDRFAPSKLSVLILGETGTGKEVYARALHARSDRAAQPFIALNCAALVESLLESELFGHEKGAFTGAAEPKPGLIEIADGGTMFLDEIGEMALTTQAKLLRVLENGEILRIGGLKPRRIDVRLVAATNADLDAAIAAGRFRRDLYYRINGCVVTLPPLRERRGEIMPLARHFAAALGRNRFTEAAERALCEHAWPGNIRELKTVVERAALLSSRRDAIDTADLMLAPQRPSHTLPTGAVPHEREQLLEALQRANGNQKEAAKLLGLSRQTLSKKLDAHGIGRPRKGG